MSISIIFSKQPVVAVQIGDKQREQNSQHWRNIWYVFTCNVTSGYVTVRAKSKGWISHETERRRNLTMVQILLYNRGFLKHKHATKVSSTQLWMTYSYGFSEYRQIMKFSPSEEKKEEIWLSPMTKAATATKNTKCKVTTQQRHQNLITQRLRIDLGR